MFCATLRRRSFDTASVLSALSSPSTLGLRENELTTHDITLYIGPKVGPNTRQLRCLIFSPSTVSQSKVESTMAKIQHLVYLTGGQDIVVVFLISPPVGARFASAKTRHMSPEDHGTNGMLAYCKLQAELASRPELSVPILPLPKLEALPALLKSHLAAISGQPTVQTAVPTSFELLQYCTAMPPLRQQTTLLLSDTFQSIGELAEGCCSILNSGAGFSSSSSFEAFNPSSEGGEDAREKLRRLKDMIDAKEWEDIVVFWQKEWTVE